MPGTIERDKDGRGGDPSVAVRLGHAARGFVGRVTALDVAYAQGLTPDELERRLVELGIVEGARVEILHEGLFGRDPIAVRVDGTTVALRRQEALSILVSPQ